MVVFRTSRVVNLIVIAKFVVRQEFKAEVWRTKLLLNEEDRVISDTDKKCRYVQDSSYKKMKTFFGNIYHGKIVRVSVILIRSSLG